MEAYDMKEAEAWVRLMHLRGIGDRGLWSVGEALDGKRLCGDFQQDWPLLSQTELKTLKTAIHALYTDASIEKLMKQCGQLGVRVLHPHHPLMHALRTSSPLGRVLPAVSFAWGSQLSAALGAPRVAIIGSREASSHLMAESYALAYGLAKKEITIVSGYARGIDTHAHAGALNALGKTFALPPKGIFSHLDFLKPRLPSRLAPLLEPKEPVLDGLCIFSQFYPSAEWHLRQYMMRNRSICALCQRMVVMAATHTESGSYQTAQLALQLGLPLYVFMPTSAQEQSLTLKKLARLPATKVLEESSALEEILADTKSAASAVN